MPDEPVMDVENVGIMQGFKDLFEDETEMGDDDIEMAKIMDRTPDSPEILMNNLRGDMRSIDARRDELADLVGYQAAEETPESVLAMLQPVLAQQGGIGALPMPGAMPPGSPPGMPPGMPPPEMGGMPPPEMMPPPGAMPPGPPPGPPPGMPPLQMARGGIVQRFSQGTTGPTEDQDGGASPIFSSSMVSRYPDELVTASVKRLSDLSARKPAAVPSLKDLSAEKAQMYRDLLGTNKEALQGQAALDLARLFFSYAGNVDPETGKPMRGSGLSRIAQAARGLPAAVGKYGAKIGEEERALKLAGIQGAEKEIEAAKTRNQDLYKMQLGIDKEIAKGAKAGEGKGPFGASLRGNALNLLTELAPAYAAGKTTPEQDRLFETALNIATEKDYYPHPVTGDIITRQPELPKFVVDAFTLRTGKPPATTGGTGAAGTGAPATAEGATAQGPAAQTGLPTLLSLSKNATGIVPVTSTFLQRYGAGLFDDMKPGSMQADAFLSNAVNRINRAVATNPRFAEGERMSIKKELDLLPGVLYSPQAYANRLVGVDMVLERIERDAALGSNDENINVKDRAEARNDLRIVRNTRSLLGIQDLPLIDMRDPKASMATFNKIPVNDFFKTINPKTGAISIQQKTRD